MQKSTKTRQKTSKNAPKNTKTCTKSTDLENNSPKTAIKHAGGRPPKMTTKKLIAAAYEYMESAPVPNITEFALQQGYERSYLYQRAEIEKNKGKPELSNTIKMISQLKEVKLEKLALSGLCPPNFAIFALKQLGWTDKVEQTIDAEVENTGGVLMLAPRIEEEENG